MKKTLISLALVTAFSSAIAGPLSYGNAATSNGSAVVVNSQSAATASSNNTGTAWSSTQSGSFATAGQVNSGQVTNGVAWVAGVASTSEYLTSSSATTGTGSASSMSWNSSTASASSWAPIYTPGVGSGAASGSALSYSSGNVATASLGNQYAGVMQIQGNTGANASGYVAADSAIISYGSVLVGSTWVPVTNVSTETSAYAFSNSLQNSTTMYGNTPVANVGIGTNVVNNGGTATAVGN